MNNPPHEGKMAGLAAKIVAQMVDLVQEGKLGPGEKLPAEEQLLEIFDAGRASLREAIGRLEHSGYLEVRGRGEIYVKPAHPVRAVEHRRSSPDEDRRRVELFLDVRRNLEAASASAAAVACSPARRRQIRESCTAFSFGRFDLATLWQRDQEFHTAIVRASDNLYRLHEAINVFYFLEKYLRPVFVRTRFYDDNFALVVSQHEAILEAIEAGEAEEAKKRMREHIDWTNSRTLKRYS